MSAKHKSGPVVGALRWTGFLLLFLFLFQLVSGVLRHKQYGGGSSALFYTERRDSLDVLFMGSSHMLNGVSPMQLWEETGIPSHDLGQNGQVLPVTYYHLMEALRHQKPRVVVLDVYKVVQDSLTDSSAALHDTLDNMPFGLPKLRAAWDLLPEEERADYLLDITLYHTRWKQLTPDDFQPADPTGRGARTLFYEAQPDPGWFIIPESQTARPVEVALRYLEKIAQLCREQGVELLLVALPYTTPENDSMNRQAIVNGVQDYAGQWNVPFVNLLYHTDEMGFDFTRDMADVQHVNWRGQAKVTAWLGRYLTEHYNLPDRRGEEAYQDWNEALDGYHTYMARRASAAPELFKGRPAVRRGLWLEPSRLPA